MSYRPRSEDALDETLDKVVSWLEDELDLDFDPANVGADRNARLLDLSDVDDIGYAPGYVLHDGFLSFGTTEEAIEAVVSRQRGEGDALASDGEYRRATGHLPGNRGMLAYVSLQRIVSLVSDISPADLDRGTANTLEETLGALAMSAGSNDGVSRAALVLTLFPGE